MPQGPGQIPATGSSTGPLLAAGILFIAVGLGLVLCQRLVEPRAKL
jgi:LPXTG-motif cell wall-anchored protein